MCSVFSWNRSIRGDGGWVEGRVKGEDGGSVPRTQTWGWVVEAGSKERAKAPKGIGSGGGR